MTPKPQPGQPLAAAISHFVRLYTDRGSRRPVDLPATRQAALARLHSPAA